jgi:hypothetical protein
MKRRDDGDVVRAFKRLTTAADEFVDRAPRVKRIQAERTAILDAITHAELVLSVHRLPKDKEQEQESAIRSKLEEQMRPIRIELETPVQGAKGKGVARYGVGDSSASGEKEGGVSPAAHALVHSSAG